MVAKWFNVVLVGGETLPPFRNIYPSTTTTVQPKTTLKAPSTEGKG